MNPLKERIAKTKAIKTLFISSVLLVGFIGMSLSLSQTASATVEGGGPPEGSPSENRPIRPQCPQTATGFEQGECTRPPDLKCKDPNFPTLRGDVCVKVETPVEKCANNEVKVGDVCCPNNRQIIKTTASGEKRCTKEGELADDRSAKTPTQPTQSCESFGPGFNLVTNPDTGKKECVKEGPAPTKECADPFRLEGEICVTKPGNRVGQLD